MKHIKFWFKKKEIKILYDNDQTPVSCSNENKLHVLYNSPFGIVICQLSNIYTQQNNTLCIKYDSNTIITPIDKNNLTVWNVLKTARSCADPDFYPGGGVVLRDI